MQLEGQEQRVSGAERVCKREKASEGEWKETWGEKWTEKVIGREKRGNQKKNRGKMGGSKNQMTTEEKWS